MSVQDEAPILPLAVFLSDRQLCQAVADEFAHYDHDHGITVASIEQSTTFEAFDATFCVGVALSIPIGLGTGIIANWIQTRLQQSRDKVGNPAIKISN